MKYDFETILSREGTGSSKWITMRDAIPDAPEGIVPFSIADMEFMAPPQIRERIADYLENNVLGYTRKTDEYLNAVVSWMDRRHNWKIGKDWIVDFPGVVPSLVVIINEFTRPGDGIIIMPPVYYPFYDAIHNSSERILVENPLIYEENSYRIDFDDLERKAADPQNKMLIICNPHNPVGRVWTEEELWKIGEICLKHGVLIVSDDIHSDLVMEGYKHTFIASLSDEIADITITCTAPTKTFNIAALFTSNIVIRNLAMRKRFLKAKKATAINYCNVLGYQACIACYNEAEDWVDEMMVVLNRNKQMLKAFLEEKIPEIKAVELEGTYLQWLDCRALGLKGKELEAAMQEQYLFFDEGYVFGEIGDGFERLNIACPTETLQKAMERLEQVAIKYRK